MKIGFCFCFSSVLCLLHPFSFFFFFYLTFSHYIDLYYNDYSILTCHHNRMWLCDHDFITLSQPHFCSSSCVFRAGKRAAMLPSPTSSGAAFRGALRTRPPLLPKQEALCLASPVTPPASRSTSPCCVTASAREAASRWPLKPMSKSLPRSRAWLLPVS